MFGNALRAIGSRAEAERAEPVLSEPDEDTERATADNEPGPGAGGRVATGMDISQTSSLLEAEIMATLRDVVDHAASLSGQISRKVDLANSVRQQTSSLTDMAESARDHSQSLTTAIRELASSSGDIRGRVEETSAMTARATGLAEDATSRVAELKRSSGEIEEVVQLIASIAKQTNLLALNATIEAERAGEAGRGFAVVAGEVKSLSVATRDATQEIAGKIAVLQKTAEASIEAVGRIAEIISEFGPVFEAVASAVDTQVSTSQTLDETAGSTAEFVSQVAGRVATIDGATAEVAEVGASAFEECGRLGGFIDALDHRVVMLLRQTDAGDNGALDRLPAEIRVSVQDGTRPRETTTIDLSEVAATLKPIEGWLPKPGSDFDLAISGIGHVPAKLIGASQFGLNFALHPDDSESETRLREQVAEIRQQHAVLIDRAIEAADAASAAIETAISSGDLTADDVFDLDYRPISGADPQQFETRYLDTFDRILPDILEPALQSDPQMVFCAAVDRNGYLPVHNQIYSKPQRAGDPVWNAGNCRNRRIFDDRAGLSAARNTRPFLVQSYARDMGNGQVVMMKEVDAPISVFGRHWGGMRMAYRF
jgi:methyl-accepting chemotaxis protein